MKPTEEQDKELLADLDEKRTEATENVGTYWMKYNDEIEKAGFPVDQDYDRGDDFEAQIEFYNGEISREEYDERIKSRHSLMAAALGCVY